MKDQTKEIIALLLFFLLIMMMVAGCERGYRPSIIDIRDQPINIGHDPTLPDTSHFVPPIAGLTAEQMRLNHLVKFQAQLREQMRRVR